MQLKKLIISLLATTLMAPASAMADAPKNKGLLLSPLRQYTQIDAGAQKTNTLQVSNLTETPIDVVFSVESFSVTDYAYDYRFILPPKNDWIRISAPQVTLKPNEQKSIPYTLTVPAGTAPGGHYYTIFATQSKNKGSVAQQVRVGTLLYVTVNGVAQQSSALLRTKIPYISLDREVALHQDIRNTGNVHFFVYAYTKVSGMFGLGQETVNSHILMPGAIRRVTSYAELPWLPGLYAVHLGYTSELGEPVDTARAVLYLPVWFIILFTACGAVCIRWLLKRKQHTHNSSQDY